MFQAHSYIHFKLKKTSLFARHLKAIFCQIYFYWFMNLNRGDGRFFFSAQYRGAELWVESDALGEKSQHKARGLVPMATAILVILWFMSKCLQTNSIHNTLSCVWWWIANFSMLCCWCKMMIKVSIRDVAIIKIKDLRWRLI